MATVLQLKRRVSGAAGAPSGLKSAELAYNMVDGTFYVGYGDDGAGNATSVRSIAKDDFSPSQRVPSGGTSGQVLSRDGSGNLVWSTPAAGGPAYTAGTGITISGNTISPDFSVVVRQTDLGAWVSVLAPKHSPTFTGTPNAPTAATGTSNTQIATTAYVRGEINGLVNGAGAAFDTLKELGDLIVADQDGLAALTVTVGGKLAKASNLADLSDFATARSNLGLQGMATQAPNAVAITGGSIAGVTLSGGTF